LDKVKALNWVNATAALTMDDPARSLKVAIRVRIPLGLLTVRLTPFGRPAL
jgi:hypothetical protein